MRLTQLKIAGFKSFVEPTVIPTPSSLVGIVGPNGCGKSNIIDAVRWVMGESRASELRGGSMQDVIFNGSSQRKASARASVELVFDNNLGRAAGQWSAYSEISVRRVLTRDGSSSYYINNQLVRRRDIHDMFLGTGLGARGYAIIGQGMINRLIEARPEELRVYIEEAAGVSRYKERRRETERRLHDTRENLTRLDDILSELTAQVQRLENQARIATKYKNLQSEGQQKQQVLWLLRESNAKQEQLKKATEIEQAQTKLEQAIAKLRAQETQLESQRQAHYASADSLHKAQGRLYESGALVSKLEAEIKHTGESKQRLQQRQQLLQQQNTQWTEQIRYCTEQILDLEVKLEQALAHAEETDAKIQHAQDQMPNLDSELSQSSEFRENLQRVVVRIEQELALANQSDNNSQRLLQTLEIRLASLEHEQNQVQQPEPNRLDQLNEQRSLLEAELEQAKENFVLLESKLVLHQQKHHEHSLQTQKANSNLANLKARLIALEDLQHNVQQKRALHAWLQEHGLHTKSPLWQQLQIQPGWEAAIESCLNDKVSALHVNSLQEFSTTLQSDPPAKLSVYTYPEVTNAQSEAFQNLQPLSSLVSSDNLALIQLINAWLNGVYACPDLKSALQLQPKLLQGTSCVVPQGHIIEKNNIRFYAADTEQSGLLARQNEINNLQQEVESLEIVAKQALVELQNAKLLLETVGNEMALSRVQISELTDNWHTAQLEASRLQQQHEQAGEKTARLHKEIEHLHQEKQLLLAAKEQAQERMHGLEQDLLENQAKYDLANATSTDLLERAQSQRETLRSLERQQQESEYATRTVKARIEEVKRNQQLAVEQQTQAQTELNGLQGELFNLDESLANESLQQALEQRIIAEATLSAERKKQDELSAQLRSADEQRLKIEQSLEPLRAKITELQLQEQASRLAVEQFSDQLNDQKTNRQDLKNILQSAPQQWHEPAWLQSEVQRIAQEINKLGAVNLAALEELNTAREREGFLNAQHEDLSQAVSTLEDAIRNIDKETRALLHNTFNEVSKYFGELFPRLFGGGEARLTMTGEEILDSGVQVMAQPPGKRNTTIQLLSGGEKALTAIALVFALFKLNPAPFCLLDEVDAPLDDANTGRFANLVSDMSKQTQFLFVSHNKIAMQMAQQLIGVTMQEQGVSRIVAVDMESALQMAEA